MCDGFGCAWPDRLAMGVLGIYFVFLLALWAFRR